jgi:predicted dehydrogenase
MSKVRWGILSTAKIGTEKVIPAMQRGKHSEVVALASRDKDKALAAASKLAIPKAYDRYEDLLNDPEIDAIYNPLPNHMHVEWSIKALQAGKHVLCEKPIGLSSEEAISLQEESKKHPQLKLMEAFMYRHHPQWKQAKSWVNEGRIGELKTIHSFFSYHNIDTNNIRNQKEKGGGGLMDIGCYNISLSRFLFDAEPSRMLGLIDLDPQTGVDRLTSGILQFSKGNATFTCSTQLVPYQRVNIFGTEARIEIEIPFNAPPDVPTRIWLHSKKGTEEKSFDAVDQYTIQGDLFSKAILQHTELPTPFWDAINNMKVIEAIFKSGANNAWVTL